MGTSVTSSKNPTVDISLLSCIDDDVRSQMQFGSTSILLYVQVGHCWIKRACIPVFRYGADPSFVQMHTVSSPSFVEWLTASDLPKTMSTTWISVRILFFRTKK